MATLAEPEIILYDLASVKGVCFSPSVWRIRLMLNYKDIPYRTIFLEFPDIVPTLKALGLNPNESSSAAQPKYSVPAIQHLPTNTYMMNSASIAQFLEATYPDPPVPLTSELGREIEAKARSVLGKTFQASIMPREMSVLSPRSQEYFQRTREAFLGHPLENLLDLDKEEQNWDALGDSMHAVNKLMQTNKAEGPFILGARPTYTDFFFVGTLQNARVVAEGVFQRMIIFPGYKELYHACLPYLEKKD